MSTLYNNMSQVYEMMYQTFINYDEEYKYYNRKLKEHKPHSLVELGCGTGSLAEKFIANGFRYTGIDLNNAMLEIAKRKNRTGEFLKKDMRDFQLSEKKDSCILAGRTSAYLITNKDVFDTFRSINNNLNSQGVTCFDAIDAMKFIPQIKNGKKITHSAEFENKKFQRESYCR